MSDPQVRLAARLDGPDGAPVVVLAHPIGATSAIWDAQVRVLAKRYRVLRFEARGHGAPGSNSGANTGARSPAPPGPYTIADLAADVLRLLDEHDIANAAFCGVSLGGMTGLWLAANAADRITSLVVCCTAITPMPSRQAWLDRAGLVRAAGLRPIAEMAPARWFTPDFVRREPQAVEAVIEMLLGTDPEGYAGCADAIAEMDLRPSLAAIKVPTLVIAAAEDPAAPPWVAAQTARGIAGSRLVVIRGTSHLAVWQTPGPVTAAISGHLSAIQ